MSILFPQKPPPYDLDSIWKKVQSTQVKVTPEDHIHFAQVIIYFMGLNKMSCSAVRQLLIQKNLKPLKKQHEKVCQKYQEVIKCLSKYSKQKSNYYRNMMEIVEPKKRSIFAALKPESDLLESNEKIDEIAALVSQATSDMPASLDAGGELEEFIYQEVKEERWNFRGKIAALFKTNMLALRISWQNDQCIYLTWMQALMLWKKLNGQKNPQEWMASMLKDKGFAFFQVALYLSPPREWPFTRFGHSSFRYMVWTWSLLSVLTYFFGKKVFEDGSIIGKKRGIDNNLLKVKNLCKSLAAAITLGELDVIFSGGQRVESLYAIAKTKWCQVNLTSMKKKEGLTLYNTFLWIKKFLTCKGDDETFSLLDIKLEAVQWAFYHNTDPSLNIFPLPFDFSKFHEKFCLLQQYFTDKKRFWKSGASFLAAFVQCKNKGIGIDFCVKMLCDFFAHPRIEVAEKLKNKLMLFFLTEAKKPQTRNNLVVSYFQMLVLAKEQNLKIVDDEKKDESTIEKDAVLTEEGRIKTCIQAFWSYVENSRQAAFLMLVKLQKLRKIDSSCKDTIDFLSKVIKKMQRAAFSEQHFDLMIELHLSFSPENQKASIVLFECYQFCCGDPINQGVEIFNTDELAFVYQVLKEKLSKLKVRKQIGSGGYGKVFLVDHCNLSTNELFVLKTVRFVSIDNPSIQINKKARSGEALAVSLNHDNLLPIKALITVSNLKDINSDSRGELHQEMNWDELHGHSIVASFSCYFFSISMETALNIHGKFTSKTILYLASQLIDVIWYLHDQEIAHRDIKAGNILIGKKFKLKLIDHDGLREKGSRWKFRRGEDVGTPAYQAPEILLEKEFCNLLEADMYAFGVFLQTLLFGGIFDSMQACHFKHQYKQVYVDLIKQNKEAIVPKEPKASLDSLGKKLYTLMRGCLLINSAKRYKATEVKKKLKLLSDESSITSERDLFFSLALHKDSIVF